MTRVIIDAGHGGTRRIGNSSAFGGQAASGLLEKDVTLDIARAVVGRLGAAASLTRATDSNLSLGARAAQASHDGAEVFVSIHANSGSPEDAGAETWVHPDAGAGSHSLAAGVQRALDRLGGRYGGAAEPRTGQMAVLSPSVIGRRTDACLVEVDYLSNPRSAARLGDPRERAAIGAAIADAIGDHLRGTGRRTAYGDRPSPDPYIVPDSSSYTGRGLIEFVRVWASYFGRWARWRAGVPHDAYSYFPHSAICELELSGPSFSRGYGTGFFIGPNKILTCGHNFKLGSATTTQVIVRPGKSPVQSVWPERTFTVNWRDLVHPNWADTEDYDWDMAVLRTPGLDAPNGEYFALPNATPAQTERIVVCGYGKFQGDGSANDPEEGQYLDGGTITHATFEQYHFPIQAIPGHSGSPVFWNDMAIAILTGPRILGRRISDTENRGVRLTPEKNDWINSK